MRSSILPACALAVAACSSANPSNEVDLPPIEGAPVRIVHAKTSESVAAGLGAAPVRMSSTSAHNAISIDYEARVVGRVDDHGGVSTRLACRVDDYTIVTGPTHDAMNRLASIPSGQSLPKRDTFMPTAFSAGVPETCEFSFLYQVSPPLRDVPEIGSTATPPQRRHTALGELCFARGVLTEGACGDDVLPRRPADAPLVASELVGRIAAEADGTHRLGVSVLVTAGEGVPAQIHVTANATCDLDGTPRDVRPWLHMFERDLRPGESAVGSGSTSPADPLPSAPTWCHVDVSMAEAGTVTSIGDFCVRGETTTRGACT